MSQIFDRQAALEQAGGSPALLAELIEVFSEEAATLLGQLRQAIEQGDAAEVQRTAHTIKGSARVFGAETLAAAAQRLEGMGRDNDLAEARPALTTLNAEVDRLLVALSAETQNAS